MGARRMRIGDIAAGRAGDNGDTLDLTLVAYDDQGYRTLSRVLTSERVARVLEHWRCLLTHTVAKGIVAGEIRADVNPDEVATRIICGLEGGHLLRHFYDEGRYLEQMGRFLIEYIERDLRARN